MGVLQIKLKAMTQVRLLANGRNLNFERHWPIGLTNGKIFVAGGGWGSRFKFN